MGLFSARWFLQRLFSSKFRRELNQTVEFPTAFYCAALMKFIPGLWSGKIDLHHKSGGIVSVYSFMTLYIFEEVFLDRVYDRHSRAGTPGGRDSLRAGLGRILSEVTE
jgi:hypothetical protein